MPKGMAACSRAAPPKRQGKADLPPRQRDEEVTCPETPGGGGVGLTADYQTAESNRKGLFSKPLHCG